MLTDWLPAVGVIVVMVLAIALSRLVVGRSSKHNASDRRFRQQIATIVIVLVGLLAVIFVLPDGSDSDLAFSVLGLVVTGALAISSQSIIANAMAGLMLRSVASFRPGDFIEVGERMGRVSELGLFHTEIQTPDRDLVTIPNSVMMNQPLRVVHSSGTIVSATVSLGYDVSRHVLEPLFIRAGREAGLVDPFVQVLELGDYSIVYRIAGFLEDPRSMLAARSKLRGSILDVLSDEGIEIMSPMFIARRSVSNAPLLPDGAEASDDETWRPSAEHRVFDKAERAGQLESARRDLSEAEENLSILRLELGHTADEDRDRVETAIGKQEARIERLQQRIGRLSDELESESQ